MSLGCTDNKLTAGYSTASCRDTGQLTSFPNIQLNCAANTKNIFTYHFFATKYTQGLRQSFRTPSLGKGEIEFIIALHGNEVN